MDAALLFLQNVRLSDDLFTILDDNTFGLCIGPAAIECVGWAIGRFYLYVLDARCLVDRTAASGTGGGQRVAVAVDGTVVDQSADAGDGHHRVYAAGIARARPSTINAAPLLLYRVKHVL